MKFDVKQIKKMFRSTYRKLVMVNTKNQYMYI